MAKIDHNFRTPDELRYTTREGIEIPLATIVAFSKANWDLGNRSSRYAVGSTRTTVDGRWSSPLELPEGEFVLVFQLAGRFGPDIVTIRV